MATKKTPSVPEQAPVPETPANADSPAVATVQGLDGTTFYAWRKDGRKPNVNEAEWARNIHAALSPLGDADFADRVGPK